MPIPYRNDLTAEFVRNLFDYDAAAAQLVWKRSVSQGRKSRGGNSKAGKVAGMIFTNGYRYIKIKISGKKRYYLAHRLIHLHQTGEWPAAKMDHEDHNISSSKKVRLADNSQNQFNRGKQKNNTSGYKGVYWHRQAKKWGARIAAYCKTKSLGLYATREEAHAAYCKAAKELHGEFANFG